MEPDVMELGGRRVVVMGLGRFGGGIGVTRWLAGRGARVLVTDLASEASLAGSIAQLGPLARDGVVTLRLGEHREADFASCDLVVASPAVPRPWENRYLDAARSAEVPVTTEIQLSIDRLAQRGARLIGVTGSAGKSTTTAMIAHALNAVGERAVAGGNLGGCILDHQDRIEPGTWAVLELSSAMLHWIERLDVEIAVVTSYAPNHLDWHGSVEHYGESKRRLLASISGGGVAILGPGLRDWPVPDGVRRLCLDLSDGIEGLATIGPHNGLNAAMARAAVEAATGVPREAIEGALRGFQGLAHRLQVVGERCSVRFINDSKATTPEATVVAVRACGDCSRIHLIAGGYDKGVSLGPIRALAPELAGLYAIGSTASDLTPPGSPGMDCGALDRAFEVIRDRVREGDTVLLSPGCASWDQYDNFEERGDAFIALAKAWIGR